MLEKFAVNYLADSRSLLRLLLQTLIDNVREALTHTHGQRRELFFQDFLLESLRVRSEKRFLLSAKLIENDTEGPDVGLLTAQIVRLREPKLRGQVERRPHLPVLVISL